MSVVEICDAEGIRLLPKRALLHLIAQYLRPEGRGAKHSYSGCVKSCSIVIAMRVISLLLSSVGVERPITFAAVLDTFVCLVRFLTESIL